MKKQLIADSALAIITLFWGFAFGLTKFALIYVNNFALTGIRFLIGFVLTYLILWKRMQSFDSKIIRYSLVLGCLLFGAILSMTIGVKHTSASNAGFLTNITVILVPIISVTLFKEKIKLNLIVACLFAIVGIALITINERLKINSGDFYCLLCGLIYSIYIILAGKYSKIVDPLQMGVLQLGVVGMLSLFLSLATEPIGLTSNLKAWGAILFLSIFCTGIAFVVQPVAQKYTTATHASLIFSLESVFAALAAFLLFGETLSLKGYAGAALLLLGIIVAEVDFRALAKRPPRLTTMGVD